DRQTFKHALGASLIKDHAHWPVFETLFEVYFSLHRSRAEHGEDVPGGDGGRDLDRAARGRPPFPSDRPFPDLDALSVEELRQLLTEALADFDPMALRALAHQAVTRFAGIEPGRPVGGTYYLYRALRQMDLDGLLARLLDSSRQQAGGLSPLEERLLRDEHQARAALLRREVEEEIRRRLVADRGPAAMARALRRPLPEDVDFMHASREELAALRRAIHPLSRKLAVRLARKRRHGRVGPLDFRSTMRHSLSYGGVPADPRFRRPRPARPELALIADVSGSVASFARFTLQLVYAVSLQFTKVRCFVFIDGIDEVTDLFERADDVGEALARVATEADVVRSDGHSDYGHALLSFTHRWVGELSPRTGVIVLGDARNNYHAAESWALGEIRARARRLYWLNPEPRSYWDTGDSIMSEYAPYCDGTFECRNLRQLEHFVEELV
ncbi:MAG: VWA domain-containing protein, partial [Acidimicrobiales bacterium]|nr:VWA domain-containing protein [Acidimicrobiales bacterium]